MSMDLIRLAASIEGNDEFHLARVLILLKAVAKKSNKSVEGITKLAKLDFLTRYPIALVRLLNHLGKEAQAAQISEAERQTIEGAMIRFRYGPWDTRYRRWLALLAARGLVDVYQQGATVHVKLTDTGSAQADELTERDEFQVLFLRCKLVVTAVGGYGATKLMNLIYEVFPELLNHRWGERLRL